MSDQDDDDLAVTHRQVSAAQAAPVATTAPNSVFALGAQAAASGDSTPPQESGEKPAGAKRAKGELEQLLLAALAGGELSATRLGLICGTTAASAANALNRMLRAGKVAHARKEGKHQLWRLAETTPSNFKGWLARKGEASAEGRAPARRGRKPGKPAKAPAAPVAPVAPARAARAVVARAEPTVTIPQGPDEVVLGLYSTGHVSIAVGDQALRLTGAQAKRMFAWLASVDAVLQA